MQLPKFDHLPRSGAVPGLTGAARALFLLRLGRPVLALCREPEDAVRLHRDLRFFAEALGTPPPLHIPPREDRLRPDRLDALQRVGDGQAMVAVACLEAARAPVSDAAALIAGAIELRAGAEIEQGFIAERLGEMGYRRAAVVTDAELTPTGPLTAEENYCDDCRLCMAACASALMHPEEKTTVTMGAA